MIRRLLTLIGKEFLQAMRDPSCILIAFVLPMFLLFLFGYGVSLDCTHVKIALVVEDKGRAAQSLADSFASTKYFDVRMIRTRQKAEEELVAGRIRGIVIIPSYFSERLLRQTDAAPLQVISDGSEPNTASFVENYATGVFSTWLTQQGYDNADARKSPVQVASRFWFNPELKSRNTLLPGSIAIILAVIGTLLTAMVVAREWERGTMESMMVTPAGIGEILAGKLIPYFILGMCSMLVSVAVSRVLFELPMRGSMLSLCVVSAAFLLASLSLGLLISTAAKNQFHAGQTALIAAYLPAMLLSGFIFEIDSMPAFVRAVTYAVPARYLVACLKTIFLSGDIPAVLVPNTLAMLAIAAFILLLTLRKTAKSLE
jgi:ABC-2 type transport system permease protein